MTDKLIAVWVLWEDSASHLGWSDIDDAEYRTMNCISIGWLVNETDKNITISHAVGVNRTAADAITIPKSCIKRRKNIMTLKW